MSTVIRSGERPFTVGLTPPPLSTGMNFILQAGQPYVQPPAYTHLKRARSRDGDGFTFNPALAPPLPQITNIDTLLQVFTHPSIRRQPSPMAMETDDYADNERLTFLGKLTLETAVIRTLFNHRPMLKAYQMTEKKQELLSDEAFDAWVSHYKLLTKLRCDLDLRSSYSINKPQETRAIFHAYVGGLYIDSGADFVYGWIARLLEQYLTSFGGQAPPEPMVVNEKSPPPARTQTPPPLKKVKAELVSPGPTFTAPPGPPAPPQPPIFFGSQPLPSPVRQAPPHMPPPMSFPMHPPPNLSRTNPLAPAQPNLPFLPLFNQTAAQRRVSVEYTTQFSGPSHAGTWLVRCVVNGIPKGEGTGSSKQTAKEEAARQAFYAMGWT